MKPIERITDFAFEDKHDSEHLPAWYYGFAYRDYQSDYSVFAIMPLNWLIRAQRWLSWRWDRFRGSSPKWILVRYKDVYSRDEYQRGYGDGYETGRLVAMGAIVDPYG